MSTSWTIGNSPDCDLVVNLPTVSGRHCRLTRDDGGFLLEDLRSTNGTYLNGARVTGIVRVTKGDAITLGLTIPMPWPPETSPPVSAPASTRSEAPRPPILAFRGAEMVIGRNPDCQRIIDLPMVSGRHARLVRSAGRIEIEDLGSSNGTFVNGQRIDRAVAVLPGDMIGLGSYVLVLADGEKTAPAPADVAIEHGKAAVPTLPPAPSDARGRPAPWWGGVPEEFARAWKQPARLAALLAQAPLLALAIVAALRVDTRSVATPEGWATASRTIAALLSWLVLAALWFGLSDALLGLPPDAIRTRGGPRLRGAGVARTLARLAALGGLCLLQCVLAWAVVSNGAGLKGAGLSALGLLVMASATGLALGLTVDSLAPRPAFARAILPAVMLLLWLLGGQAKPLPAMPSWARMSADLLPSRWAFEGLLLLESDRQASPTVANNEEVNASATRPERDLAEDYFPAETERMGVPASATALAAIFLALSASAAFISEES